MNIWHRKKIEISDAQQWADTLYIERCASMTTWEKKCQTNEIKKLKDSRQSQQKNLATIESAHTSAYFYSRNNVEIFFFLSCAFLFLPCVFFLLNIKQIYWYSLRACVVSVSISFHEIQTKRGHHSLRYKFKLIFITLDINKPRWL